MLAVSTSALAGDPPDGKPTASHQDSDAESTTDAPSGCDLLEAVKSCFASATSVQEGAECADALMDLPESDGDDEPCQGDEGSTDGESDDGKSDDGKSTGGDSTGSDWWETFYGSDSGGMWGHYLD